MGTEHEDNLLFKSKNNIVNHGNLKSRLILILISRRRTFSIAVGISFVTPNRVEGLEDWIKDRL